MSDANRLPRRRFLGAAAAALLAGCRAADAPLPTQPPAAVPQADPTASPQPTALAATAQRDASATPAAPAEPTPLPTAEPTQPPPTRTPPAGPLAPEIRSDTWINSAPLTWSALRGRVVMVEFWTYG
jgi:hypothetical protein